MYALTTVRNSPSVSAIFNNLTVHLFQLARANSAQE